MKNALRSRMGMMVLCLVMILGGYYLGKPLIEDVEFAHAAGDVQATRQQLSTVEDLSTVFRHVGQVVEPSVVNITVHKTIKESREPGPDLFRRFFQDPNNQGEPSNPDNDNDGDNEEYEQVGTGSGVIMEVADGNGYILTNNHVAGGSKEMDITLADGRQMKGKLLGADAKSDLAVVQITADHLIPAQWGNSDDLEKGDWILAFGSPFGYIGSMTHGIVSALNRHGVGIIGQDGYENFIQVDAPINPGNSGGPLVNIHGEVVGINTAIATRSGGFQGIGFAIPSDQAKGVYTQLKQHGSVTRGWLGVGIGDVSANTDLASSVGYQGTTGVLVKETFRDTPASGKLQVGDVITAINNQTTDTTEQLRNLVAATAPNTKINLKVIRGGKTIDVEITLGTQPEDMTALLNGGPAEHPAPASPTQKFGMSLQTLTEDTATQLCGITDVKTGAVITKVNPTSIAAMAGLRPGQVITMIGTTPIHSAQDAIDALAKVDIHKGKGVSVYYASHEGASVTFLKGNEETH